MTDSNKSPNNGSRDTDRNRAYRLAALQLLQELLAECCQPGFVGTSAVKIEAQNGFIRTVRKSVEQRISEAG